MFSDTSTQIAGATGAFIDISVHTYVTINEKNEKMRKVNELDQMESLIEENPKLLKSLDSYVSIC